MPRYLKITFYSAIVLVLLVITVWNKIPKNKANPVVSSSKNLPQALKVNATLLKLKPYQRTIDATGTVLANEEVNLYSEVQGVVKKVYFSEGSEVKKGQLLIKLVDDEWRAEFKKAQSNRELLAFDEARAKNMLEKEAISKAEYDAALYKLKMAEAECELIRAKLAKTEIRAPFGGKIGFKYISEGSLVQPFTLLANLLDVSLLKTEFSIPSVYAPYIKKGLELVCKLDGYDYTFPAKIYATEPKINEDTRMLKIRALINADKNTKGVIPGAFIVVNLPIYKSEKSILIPTYAVIPDLNKYKIFIQKNGVAKEVFIQVLDRTSNEVEIKGEIAEGDTLLTTGLLQLRNNMPVKAILE